MCDENLSCWVVYFKFSTLNTKLIYHCSQQTVKIVKIVLQNDILNSGIPKSSALHREFICQGLNFGCKLAPSQFKHHLLNKVDGVFHALGIIQVQGKISPNLPRGHKRPVAGWPAPPWPQSHPRWSQLWTHWAEDFLLYKSLSVTSWQRNKQTRRHYHVSSPMLCYKQKVKRTMPFLNWLFIIRHNWIHTLQELFEKQCTKHGCVAQHWAYPLSVPVKLKRSVKTTLSTDAIIDVDKNSRLVLDQ